MTKLFPLFAALVLVLFAFGCVDDDDPIIDEGEELITSVTLTLTPNDAANGVVVYGFSDPDGDGGNDPMMSSTGTLVAGATYGAQVSFGGPDGSIDAEIIEEGLEHQVFYLTTADLAVAYTMGSGDVDSAGNPIGLRTDVVAGAAGSGELTVVLRHEPTKGFAIDQPAQAGGETDVEVTFPVVIQ